MRCAILQPSYIPWRGYFDQIRRSDVFVFYDDVQFDKHGWRNRNRIKSHSGPIWLTIPVLHKGTVTSRRQIRDIRINWDSDWAGKHLASIRQAYSRAPFYKQYQPLLAHFLLSKPSLLSELVVDLTIAISGELGFQTRFVRSSDLGVQGGSTDRLLQILSANGATHYISGPSAQTYLDEDQFDRAGIQLEYMSYSYPEYPQLHPPYDPYVSIMDTLFMLGPGSSSSFTRSSVPIDALEDSRAGRAHVADKER